MKNNQDFYQKLLSLCCTEIDNENYKVEWFDRLYTRTKSDMYDWILDISKNLCLEYPSLTDTDKHNIITFVIIKLAQLYKLSI